MIELLIGILGCAFLYWLGGIWMPEQESIKTKEPPFDYTYEYEQINEYVKLIEGEEE
tara:strand:+ start:1275 stop:1445 length:171 start_codon:yes stop_codon:yes gene_type:complete